ncbi:MULTISPECIES: tripartite tricarboxylate transporter permease [unclassified Nocardiopsis]|uniref:tripartite tricarboxylate transporter permease n=1 Tax=unclassified Nocardiopsis TaxID=2649073 RepID=UPI00066BDF4D|nr:MULTISPECIES: tripartite tricarboxylate transporter permease [unclassified Nocardiopsis]MBQ1080262.1 tripartite tricarboxylate transporter permease [Nocardiopsis sp. B62]
MDTLINLADGLAAALTPQNLMWAFLGVLLGTAVGVLPGMGSAMAVALLLPVTFRLDPTSAFILFAGVYYGGMFGGATTSILLNTPGQASSIATTYEGHKMALKGRAAQALGTAVIGSFVASVIGTLVVALFAPVMVAFALNFGPGEYFALTVFSFVAVAAVVSGSVVRGIASLLIGLAIGFVGIDGQSGAARFDFGSSSMLDGIDIVIVTVGLLALGEVLYIAARGKSAPNFAAIRTGRPWLGRKDLRRSWKPWLRGTAMGSAFGPIPGSGAEIPTFLSLGLERKLAERRERRTGEKSEFGQGAIEGVAGPESANNSSAAGTMVPLLGLGLPTSATAAIMLAAFQQYGLQPGPVLFERNADLVWTLLASLLIGSVLLLVINLPFAPLWAKLLKLPKPYLYAGITLFSVLAVYAINTSVTHLVMLLAIALLGLGMRTFGVPVAPALIGVVLGPIAETEFRRALAASSGDPAILVSSGISIGLYVMVLIAALVPLISLVRRRAAARRVEVKETADQA